MRFKNPIVDRIWLGLIGLSFLFWNVLMFDRLGPRGFALWWLIVFLIVKIREA